MFITSHILQNLENLVNEVMFLDRGGEVLQTSLDEFMTGFKQFRFKRNGSANTLHRDDVIRNLDITGDNASVFSFRPMAEVGAHLAEMGIETPGLEQVPMTLEDAFIGLTGKY